MVMRLVETETTMVMKIAGACCVSSLNNNSKVRGENNIAIFLLPRIIIVSVETLTKTINGS